MVVGGALRITRPTKGIVGRSLAGGFGIIRAMKEVLAIGTLACDHGGKKFIVR